MAKKLRAYPYATPRWLVLEEVFQATGESIYLSSVAWLTVH